MAATPQFLIALRLLNTVENFYAHLNIFLEAGKVQLYCHNDRILFIELGDLFPASWLSKMTMGETAARLRSAASSEEKIEIFRTVTENPELKNIFVEVVKKHLSDFFASPLRKCEMKVDHFQNAPHILMISELMNECAGGFLKSFSVNEMLPNNEIPFRLAPDYLEKTSRIKITLQEGYLLSRLEQPHVLSEVLSTVPADEDSVKRSLLMLWTSGVIDSAFLNQMIPKVAQKDASIRVGISEKLPDALRDQVEMIDQTYQGLSRKDFYNLLGVPNRATLPEIKTAYYKLARKFHPDRFYGLEDSVIKEKVDIIFSTINIAYETLKNTKSRHQYDTSPLQDKIITHSTVSSTSTTVSSENLTRVAEDYYQRAQKAHSTKNFYESVQFLRSATQISPNTAKYWRQLGISLSKNDQWRKEAEDSFQRAVELEPSNVENHLFLGFLYKNSGLKLRAKKCFIAALELDPKNEVALTEMADFDSDDKLAQHKKSLLGGIFKKK